MAVELTETRVVDHGPGCCVGLLTGQSRAQGVDTRLLGLGYHGVDLDLPGLRIGGNDERAGAVRVIPAIQKHRNRS